MSLFRGEAISDAKAISFGSRTAPVSPAGTAEFYFDNVQNNLLAASNGVLVAPVMQLYRNTTPVAGTTGGPNTLMSATLPITLANAVGKTLRVFAAGTYNTNAAGTPALTFVVAIGGTNVLTWTTAATTGAQANFPWETESYITVVSNGATATVEAHGNLQITLGSNAQANCSTILDNNSAVSGSINLQANANVAIISSGTVANVNCVVSQRFMTVEVCN